MIWEVEVEDEVARWLLDLSSDDYDQVVAAIEVLRTSGPSLGRPLVDTIKGSQHKNMKELRPGSRGRSELRILFAFDPQRVAILLVAGNKEGNWIKWYRTAIKVADERFAVRKKRKL